MGISSVRSHRGVGQLAGPVSASEFRFSPGAWLDLASRMDPFVPFLDDAARAAAGENALNYSGKLTVLLVGSDWRPNSGERLDTIMVMSIDSSKNIKAVSIPRDSARIPIAPSLGGGNYHGKINGMFKYFKNQPVDHAAAASIGSRRTSSTCWASTSITSPTSASAATPWSIASITSP